MKVFRILEARLLQILDNFYARRPQPIPAKDRLQQCKIVAHRGDHDNLTVFENTFTAFDRAKAQGVWGIEFDLRWTRDLYPVAIHDADLRRVFGSEREIRKSTLAELKSECPLVPSLAAMIQRYGKQIHLMIEIKSEIYPDPDRQGRILKDLFSALEPEKDYHFLAMKPKMFDLIRFVPQSTFLPIARFNFWRLSSLAIRQNLGGIAGHYFLLSAARQKKHQKMRQNMGTGYVNSKNCLFRELNRHVEWVFSDNAVELQKIVNHLLSRPLNGRE